MAEWQGQDSRVNRAWEVPAHIVRRLAELAPEPRGIYQRMYPEAWAACLERVALEIWHEAYVAGAAHGISITHTPKYILVTEEQQAAMIARMDPPDPTKTFDDL